MNKVICIMNYLEANSDQYKQHMKLYNACVEHSIYGKGFHTVHSVDFNEKDFKQLEKEFKQKYVEFDDIS